jgi:hypothetical protein
MYHVWAILGTPEFRQNCPVHPKTLVDPEHIGFYGAADLDYRSVYLQPVSW